MAEKLSVTTPPSKPFPGSLTPGWNDPPPVSDSRTPGRKKFSLNKRVAFPLHTESNNATPIASILGDSNLPPLGDFQPSSSLLTQSSEGLHLPAPEKN